MALGGLAGCAEASPIRRTAFWSTESTPYGETGGIPGDVFEITDDPVYKLQYVVSSGILRGIKFTMTDNRVLAMGLTPCTSVALDNPDAVFTDLQTWRGPVNSSQLIWGAKFSYRTP